MADSDNERTRRSARLSRLILLREVIPAMNKNGLTRIVPGHGMHQASVWTVVASKLVLLSLLMGLAANTASGATVDFQRDIRPILAEHCTQCHGVDMAKRESGLRLDQRDGALKGGESGKAAIVPGKPEMSELVRRITSTDPSEVMPPPSEKKPLTPQQMETLQRWVAEGAVYEEHWAFTAPRKLPQPGPAGGHPIDAFVAAKLAALKLNASPPATPSALCRRLYLDLIGLPPSPQELVEFTKHGYAATVEKLLKSERFGEKWARHWLDAARYSDTNGYEKDLMREQWAWRDWVINAFNADMPYNQFLIEQIAGDLLPHASQDQMIATGFLRNSMINEEGAIVPEQFRMVEMFDRMDCLGKAVLGLTTQCAQCHSHKFDPITQAEYYGMFAAINNAYEAQSWVYTSEQQAQITRIRQEIARIEEQLKKDRPGWMQEYEAWEAELRNQQIAWEPLIATELGSVSGLNHPTQEADKSLLMRGHTSADIFMIAAPDLKGVTGLRLEALNHGDLPHRGPGRSGVGTWVINELEVFVKRPDAKDWEKLALVNATADFSEPDQKQPDGKNAKGPVAYLIDGKDDTSWRADRGVGRRNQPSVAVMQFDKPLDLPPGTQLKIALKMGDMLGCGRLSVTRQPAPVAPAVPHDAILSLETPVGQRSASQQATLFAAWRMSRPELQTYTDQIEAQWKSYPNALTSILHLAEREPSNRRVTHLLDRGSWDQPRDPVGTLVPVALHPIPEANVPDRLRFARWLADERSPLTARVAVNRVWQAIFGEGLVETSEDFGTRAPTPEYREVLDWLAVDFMEHGWSHKHLIRTIVSSATYQQSSQVTPMLQERDPKNRLLARGPRFRAEAEVVRDIALSVSGLLSTKMGGPGVIPPVPQNVLDYNYTYPSYWKPAQGPDRYRRTVYGFRKRSMPDPVMSTFDAPNGDFACARRVRSNTPLAALTGLNEPVFVEAAQGLALRILREGGGDDGKRTEYAFLLCASRKPTGDEIAAVRELLDSRRKRIADGWLNPREIATGDPAKLPELPPNATPQDAAAWTLVARVLLNLDETISKN